MVLFSGVITLYVTRYDVLVYNRNNDEPFYNILVNDVKTQLYFEHGGWKASGIQAELAARIGSYLPALQPTMATNVGANANA